MNEGWALFAPGKIRMLYSRCIPRYGWNPLRWLVGIPLFYEVQYTFQVEKPDNVDPQSPSAIREE